MTSCFEEELLSYSCIYCGASVPFYDNCVLWVYSQCPCVHTLYAVVTGLFTHVLLFNLEGTSAAEISSGPRSAPWVSPLASATGVISKVFFCVALFIYVLARLPQYL